MGFEAKFPLPTSADAVAFRPARIEDLPAVRAMRALSLSTLGIRDYGAEEVAGLLATRDTAPQELVVAGRMMLALIDGRIVGTGGWAAYCLEETEPADGTAEIRAVFVHPAAARRGIASQVLNRVESAARAAGADHAALTATLTGVPLYTGRGYRPVRHLTLPLKNGLRFRAVRMVKSLR